MMSQQLLPTIFRSAEYRDGTTVLFLTWDEGSSDAGCCRLASGGHVVTIVITNHGHFPTTDGTAYNHYSLLRSMEDAFGLPLIDEGATGADSPTTSVINSAVIRVLFKNFVFKIE